MSDFMKKSAVVLLSCCWLVLQGCGSNNDPYVVGPTADQSERPSGQSAGSKEPAVAVKYTVMTPLNGTRYSGGSDAAVDHAMPSVFSIRHDRDVKDGFDVLLNGQSIRQHMVFNQASDGAYVSTVSTDALTAFVRQGDNELRVSSDKNGPSVTFYVDSSGPVISLTDVKWQEDHVALKGHAVDPSGVSALWINGVQVDVSAKGVFESTLPVSRLYQFEAEDTLGFKREVTYLSSGDNMNTFKLRIGQELLDVLTEEVGDIEGVTQELDVEPVIMNDLRGGFYTSLIGEGCYFVGCWARMAGDAWMIDVEKITIDSVSLNEMNIKDGGIYVHVTLNNMRQHGTTHVRNCNDGGVAGGDRKNEGCWSYWSSWGYTNTDLGFTKAVATGHMNFSVEEGKVSLSMGPDFDLSLSGAYAASGTFSSGTLSSLMNFANGVGLKGLVSGMIKGTMERLLAQQFNNLIVAVDEDIALPTDQTMTLKAVPESIQANEGEILVDFSGSVSSTVAEGVMPALGSVYVASPLPELRDDPDNPNDSVALAINANLINQSLLAAYHSGMTHIATTGKELEFGVMASASSAESGNMRVSLTPSSPGYVEMSAQGGESHASVVFNAMEMAMQLRKSNGEFGSGHLFKVGVDVRASVAMELEDGSLWMRLNGVPDITINNASALSFIPISPKLLNAAKDLLLTIFVSKFTKERVKLALPALGDARIETYTLDMTDGHIHLVQGLVQ